MPYVSTDDDVKLYYEVTGDGPPIVFVHEFAGDHRSWEPQIRFFSRRYKCITYCARGFIPSDVPAEVEKYSQERARDDLLAVVRGLELEQPHLVGLSMGAFAVLHFAMKYPQHVGSMVISGCGYGSELDRAEQFAAESELSARRFESLGMEKAAKSYALGPTRVQFQNKDPRGWDELHSMLQEHSSKGSANTLRGIQKRRPSIYSMLEEAGSIKSPALIITGDEDWPCIQPSIALKKAISTSGLAVIPNAGHTINLEEPAAYNALIDDFLHAVAVNRWPDRDPGAMKDSILGVEDI